MTLLDEARSLPSVEEPARRSPSRSRTISIDRMPKRERERARLATPTRGAQLPATRGDCLQGEDAARPCPYVSCKHHTYLDVSQRTGSIKLNYPSLEVWELPESCALDVADRGGVTLEEVGEILNLTRERIRQLETAGLAKLKALAAMGALAEYAE